MHPTFGDYRKENTAIKGCTGKVCQIKRTLIRTRDTLAALLTEQEFPPTKRVQNHSPSL